MLKPNRGVGVLAGLLGILLLPGCISGRSDKAGTGDSAVRSEAPAAPGQSAIVPPGTGSSAVVPIPQPVAPPADDPCKVFEKLVGEAPHWLAAQGIVLTRFMKPCVTRDGRRGYEKNTPWLAMGFPCTGGSGRIDIKGHYHNPKMVSFMIGTDCPMHPSQREQVQKSVQDAYSLPAEARLLALTPYVVQYWEVPGMNEADTGFSVELRSANSLGGYWKKFQDHQALPVRLFGRENAWVRSESMYEVEGELTIAGRTAFRLTVKSVRSLSPEQITEVRERCQQLRPERDCQQIF